MIDVSSYDIGIRVKKGGNDLEMQGVPVADRRQLMSTGYPPFDTWRIWIARFDGANPEDRWSRHLGMQMVSSPDEIFRPHKCNTQVTTMVIGELCAHLVSSSVMRIPSGYTGVELTAIWPPRPVLLAHPGCQTPMAGHGWPILSAFPAIWRPWIGAKSRHGPPLGGRFARQPPANQWAAKTLQPPFTAQTGFKVSPESLLVSVC